MSRPRCLVVIPARYGASRFPGKPLADLLGRPLIQWVWDGARQALGNSVDRIVVATDDERIARAVRAFGGEAVMTSPARRTGSDRAAEAVLKIEAELIVNLQADEILRSPAILDEAIEPCLADPALEMSTLKQEITTWAELADPNVVKVVTDARGLALYFSRAAIPFTAVGPFVTAGGPNVGPDGNRPLPAKQFYKHLGVYVYRRPLLLRFAEWPTAPLEAIERLEQLRALTQGVRIRVIETGGEAIRVDTPADLERARARVREGP